MYWKQKRIVNFKIFGNYWTAYNQRRWKGNDSYSVVAKKKLTSKDKALEHFDDFYGSVFKKQWPSIRLALLSSQKYIAVVNNFSDNERIMSYLENLGGINISKFLEVQTRKLNKRFSNKVDFDNKKLRIKIQQFTEKKMEEEFSALYPPNKELNDATASSGLEKPSTFDDRLIEPSLGLSAYTLSEYVPASKLIGMENWVPESQHYSYYAENQEYPVKTIDQDFLQFPPYLHAYTFELGNVEQFPPPKKGSTGVSDYYLLNGGSLLPVLALDLQPGDNILDMCAAPGGKGLLCLQTLYPRTVVLNDLTDSRVTKIKRVMKEFFYNFEEKKEKGEIIISQKDGCILNMEDTFNKILVDVPCTTDRHSVMEEDNNIFKTGRIKERIKIPELQSALLINALKLVRVGGTVVYSTCSLSPTQNDGVIALALRTLSQQTDNDYIIVNMKKALSPLGIFYTFGCNVGLKCGHLIVPYLPANFGPTYFCKIVRIN